MKDFCILFRSFALTALLFFPIPSSGQSATASAPSANPAPPSKSLPTDLSGSSYKAITIPQVQVKTPFAASVPASQKIAPLAFFPVDQMSDSDRALAKSAHDSIREDATLAGMEFDVGAWVDQQLVCKALPDHLFLLFQNNNGPGDVSIFSAAIPRTGKGRIRVIPVERRGYSLFSPTAVNALTISAFNRIRADEPENKSADWLATALCYAALAGARPALTAPTKDSAATDVPLVFPPTLEVGSFGDSKVRFVDLAVQRQPTEWALTFNAKGELLKVDHFPSPSFSVTSIPAK
jgi:hypothetical protein